MFSKNFGYLCVIKNCPNTYQMGENSPNLVTLFPSQQSKNDENCISLNARPFYVRFKHSVQASPNFSQLQHIKKNTSPQGCQIFLGT
jgi:hypothetical protein